MFIVTASAGAGKTAGVNNTPREMTKAERIWRITEFSSPIDAT
jgi:hypothetical protein